MTQVEENVHSWNARLTQSEAPPSHIRSSHKTRITSAVQCAVDSLTCYAGEMIACRRTCRPPAQVNPVEQTAHYSGRPNGAEKDKFQTAFKCRAL